MKKLLILMPCLIVGTVFADGFTQTPAAQNVQVQSQATQTATSLQNINQAMPTTIQTKSGRKIDAQYPFGHLSEPMSYLAFAAIIKYQFPGHDTLDSLALATSAVQAYPVYAPYVTFPSTK